MNERSRPHPEIGAALKIIRDRQQKHGDLIVPRNIRCQNCRLPIRVDQMPLIPTTGIVSNVVDCLCAICTKENAKDFKQLARIVCAGCREVVAVVEPGKEPSGFTWPKGGFVHVAECPACTSKKNLEMSPIAEKLSFYKERGIPYA